MNVPRHLVAYDKKVHGKRYGTPQKLAVAALAQKSMSPTAIARETGMDRTTVYAIMNDPEINELRAQEVQQIKDGLSKLTYKRSFEFLKAISPTKLEQSSALQLMTGAAIGIEKGRLMEGLSTENVSHRSVIEHLDNDERKLAERIRAIEEQE